MIVRLLKGSPTFAGVTYNTNKVDLDKGELMCQANFGPLQSLTRLRPQDYINYLRMVSALNKNIRDPQFHAAISAKGKAYDKETLSKIAELWLKEMGYGDQPYLITFHKDMDNNHVHVVSTRVDRHGKKIDSAFEKRRAVLNLQKVLGYEYAFGYQFSTRAQFFMLLEKKGFLGTDPDGKKIQEKIDDYRINKIRASVIKELLVGLKNETDFLTVLREQFNIELLFHSADEKKPYGYTVIDHQEKIVFKGSEVYPLQELMQAEHQKMSPKDSGALSTNPVFLPANIISVNIADDVDDQQIHGMRRRRQKKARTNTR